MTRPFVRGAIGALHGTDKAGVNHDTFDPSYRDQEALFAENRIGPPICTGGPENQQYDAGSNLD
jgi:hypothetical protein